MTTSGPHRSLTAPPAAALAALQGTVSRSTGNDRYLYIRPNAPPDDDRGFFCFAVPPRSFELPNPMPALPVNRMVIEIP